MKYRYPIKRTVLCKEPVNTNIIKAIAINDFKNHMKRFKGYFINIYQNKLFSWRFKILKFKNSVSGDLDWHNFLGLFSSFSSSYKLLSFTFVKFDKVRGAVLLEGPIF